MKIFRPALESVFSARRLATLAVAGATLLAGALAAGPAVSLPALRVNAQVSPHSVRIEALSSTAFTYTSTRPNERTLVVEIPGVTPSGDQDAKALDSGIVAGYRMVPFGDGSASGVKLQVLLTEPSEPKFERAGPQQLAIVFENRAAVAAVVSHSATIVGGGSSRISRVEVTEQNEQPILKVSGQGELHYHTSRLANPDRLVIDFADASILPDALQPTESLDPVESVRVGQFRPDVARVVVNLDRWTPFSVVTSQGGVAVSFDSKANRLDENGAKMLQASSAATKSNDTREPKRPLPAWLTQSSNALASPAQQLTPPLPQDATQANPPKQDAAAQNAAAQSTPAQQTAAPTPEASPRYSGEPISVNFKDVDLKDFFRLIHEISGLNVVLDPSVRGTLTLVLDRVPWDQALDIVLKNNNLDKQLDGNVLRIATQDTIKNEANMRADLKKAQELSVDRVTVTRQLNYARVMPSQNQSSSGSMSQQKPITEILKPFLSPRGDIVADPRTNTLIIRDIPSVIPSIDNVIRQIDKKTPQVEIDARIVQASRNFARDYGVQLAALGITNNGQDKFQGAPQAGASPVSGNPFISNLPSNVINSGIAFSHTSGNFQLDAILTAAESKGVAKVISRPKVVTQTNFKGAVSQGAQIPIQTTINNTVSTQFIDAELKLEVTPQITADGTISMEVLLENTSPDFSNEVLGQPSLNTQKVQNQVIVRDGGTVMLGGVMKSNQTTNVNQVPVLGSLPVIGHLFKEQAVSVTTSELIFFLTPRISTDN